MTPRIAGEIDFGMLAPPLLPLAVTSRGDMRSLASPGIAWSWDARHADVAFVDGVLAIAGGRAHGSPGTKQSEAAAWIGRYRVRGEEAANDVGGGFAVVLVDFGARRALMWVDRFGIETLCYRSGGQTLAFSDRARDVPGSTHQFEAQSLFDYLHFHVIPAPRTIFADVARVEAAHRIVASAGSVEASRYWRPVFVEDDRRMCAERMDEFRRLIRLAVEQESSDEQTACFLSGGTDSSTIAGMLTRVRGAPAHAYSIGFDAEGYDEMEYARIAARHFDLVHHEHYVTPDDLVDAIPEVAASFDQPFGNSSVLPAYLCARKAREDGFGRMLAGDGGDELYGGNSRYAKQKVFELYHRLPRSLRHRVLEPLACDWNGYRRIPGLRQAGGYVRHARAAMPDRLEAFNLLEFIGVRAVLDPDFLAQVDVAQPRERQRELWASSKAQSLTNRMLEYDWKYTLADSDLPKVRAASQLAGLGVGYPFLSRELTDLSLSLPPGWKVKGLTLRWFFKRALKDFLPEPILRKKKHGFGLPFGAWLLKHEPLHALAEDALHGIAARGIVRRQLVDELIGKRVSEAPGFYGELVWILMMLELWLRTTDAGRGFRRDGGGTGREEFASEEASR